MILPKKIYHKPKAGKRRLSIDLLRERAAELLPAIGEGAASRELSRELPHRQIQQLAAAQLFTFRIPKKYQGPGGTVVEAIQFIIDLAAVDSNIAQALRPSFGFVEGLRLVDSEGDRQRWYARYLAGDIFGNAGWEIGGANGEVSARISRQGGKFKVTGDKFYSTGALYADWVSSVALDEEDRPVGFIVPRNRPGLNLKDDFDAMGQRLTASGSTRLEEMTVYPEEIRQRAQKGDKRSPITPFLQLFLGAVIAGIARNALNDAVDYTRHYARPIKHSSAKVSTEDPYVQHTIGEIASRAYAAESAILRAAGALDRAWESKLDDGVLTQATVEVAAAQYIAIDTTLKAAELIFDAGGASATSRRHNLDRHWRNARTVANHNPRHWKAAAVGAFHLSGTEPPLSGLF